MTALTARPITAVPITAVPITARRIGEGDAHVTPAPTGDWVLLGGVWADTGEWIDTETWAE